MVDCRTGPYTSMDIEYNAPEYLSLKDFGVNEYWIQDLIANRPAVLGLGDDIFLRAKEKQLRAGRLDILLEDRENRRYEVEVQLGPTDPSHIVRTIEYWDVERKRYANYEHCAVLIAEDITSRFLNVISLLNRSIPIIAIQMRAVKVAGKFTVLFTKVLDEQPKEEPEEETQLPASRDEWEKGQYKDRLPVADAVLALARQIDPSLAIKYNKFYLTFSKGGLLANFALLSPVKGAMSLGFKGQLSDKVTSELREAGLEPEFQQKWQFTRMPLRLEDVQQRRDSVLTFLRHAYDTYVTS